MSDVDIYLEDEEDDSEIPEKKMKKTTFAVHDRVVELLNAAALMTGSTSKPKLENLNIVQELVLHKEPNLLDNFLDEVLAFQNDRQVEIRKFVVGFIEEACKADWEILPKVVANLQMLLMDESITVVKRTMQAATQLYRLALLWLCQAKTVTDLMESAWSYFTAIKKHILSQLDGDNDGIRTYVIKFMEMMTLLQTHTEADSIKKDKDISLDDVPLTLKIARPRKLEEEARQIMDDLLKYFGSPHISSMNLMAAMGTLTNIAKQRPQFMAKVIVALETLHANLPPTLAKSQVSSVRKMLKMQLLNLLKHPAAYDYMDNITTLLADLGASQNEVARNLPKTDELRKRQRVVEQEGTSQPKKPKLDSAPQVLPVRLEESGSEDEDDDLKEESSKPPASSIDINQEFIQEFLKPELVADLVMVSMLELPDEMPNTFFSSYTPIAAAGTPEQIKHIARLLASQLTAVNLGPGAESQKKETIKVKVEEDDDDEGGSNIITTADKLDVDKRRQLQPAGITTKPSKRMKSLKLADITLKLTEQDWQTQSQNTLDRIVQAEKWAIMGGVSEVRNKILAFLAAHAPFEHTTVLVDWVSGDVRTRGDVILHWLYHEYSQMQGFGRTAVMLEQQKDNRYDKVLCAILSRLIQSADIKERDALVSRVFLEAPVITEAAVQLAIQFCQSGARAAVGVGILKNLVLLRPPKQLVFLIALVELSAHEDAQIRDVATEVVLELNNRTSLKKIIMDYGTMYLRFLLLPQPPEMLFGGERGRPVISQQWTEDIVKVCLYLYLALLPSNHSLIHELAVVYVKTSPEIKRSILKVLELPVRGMGMDSPELLILVETCPRGAETLVTRIIHILTDKSVPSEDLVSKVRELYQKRVPDVRFLIPVINGLTKAEVIQALPKLIMLNPVIVKEVFNRLLGVNVHTSDFNSPLTAAELLVTLHTIDTSKCDIKTIIKATSICFSERGVYTAEVLAVVIQQLMEITPLPTLLMRTVIQSLSFYPRLIGFIMNVLQRLILKQVWKQKKVWEGFVKCCERSKPQSLSVLLQLPAPQLEDALNMSPDLKTPLQQHVKSFTETQLAHIPVKVLEVIVGQQATVPETVISEVKEEQKTPIKRINSPIAPPGED